MRRLVVVKDVVEVHNVGPATCGTLADGCRYLRIRRHYNDRECSLFGLGLAVRRGHTCRLPECLAAEQRAKEVGDG